MIYETQYKYSMGRYDIRFGEKFMVQVYPLNGCSEFFEASNIYHKCDFLKPNPTVVFIRKQYLNVVVPPDCTIEDLQTYIAFQ